MLIRVFDCGFFCRVMLQLVGRLWESSAWSQWHNRLPWSSHILRWRSKTACKRTAPRLVAFVDWLPIRRCPWTLC